MNSSESESGYKWKVLGIVMVGTLMSALDSSIVNVSIPSIMADFGSSLDNIEWVITSYMLAFATLMPLTAWLRDRVGHKALYIGSLAIFTGGSLLCGVAWNLPTLIVARVIQAIGGGAITPTGMAMITEAFEPHERGKALGIWGMGAVMGPAFGPTIGGYLTKYFGWPAIFLVNLPIGIAGIFFALRLLKSDIPSLTNRRTFDAAGFIFLAAFLISFLLGMSKGQTEGWTSAYIITCGTIAAVSFVLFLLAESIAKHGIMDLRLLTDPVFAACFILTAIRSVANYGGTFLLPIFLQNFRGLDEVQSGLILLPGSLLMGTIMPFAGRMGDKLGPRWMAIIGFTFLTAFFYEYRDLTDQTSTMGIIWPTLIRGVGVAMLVAPLTAAAMNAVGKKNAGMASSMMSIVQQVGGSTGIAVLSLTLSRRATYHLSLFGPGIKPASPVYRGALTALAARAHDIGHSHLESLKIATGEVSEFIVKQASILAFQDAFLVGAAITVAGFAVMMWLPNRPYSTGGKSAEPVHLE